jgi:hypothetical protein
MATNSKSNRRQRSGSSADKSAGRSKGVEDNDYPNIIEEPIRIVGDRTRAKSRAGKSRKRSAKGSAKTIAKKSGKKTPPLSQRGNV